MKIELSGGGKKGKFQFRMLGQRKREKFQKKKKRVGETAGPCQEGKKKNRAALTDGEGEGKRRGSRKKGKGGRCRFITCFLK